jgi:nucleoside-diphosphate-sugar epimerase
MMRKRALVLGAGGFIGGHLVLRLLDRGYDVIGADIKPHEYFNIDSLCEFNYCDFRSYDECEELVTDTNPDEIYALAAEMGGAGFIFIGDNDADIMRSSALIHLNLLKVINTLDINPKIFYSSSACIYPERNQLDPLNPVCSESSAYPAAPDSEYGWEKLFSERLYLAHRRNKKLDIRIARFHNIFGPQGTWRGGREKAPAAICRKVAETPDGGTIDVWGDGEQTRSFLYIDECLDGIERLMSHHEFYGPVNIGSDEMISINGLVAMVSDITGKKFELNHIVGPLGVRGRCSDNRLLKEKLGWAPSKPLREGLEKTYTWIAEQVATNTFQSEKQL